MRPVPYRGDKGTTVYADARTGEAFLRDGTPVEAPRWTWRPSKGGYVPVGVVLSIAAEHHFTRVVLTGPRPTSTSWLDHVEPGWRPAGHFYDLDDPCGRWRHERAGVVVEVRRAASWFGEGDYSVRDVAAAFDILHRIIDHETRGRVRVLATPTATGHSLWAYTLPDTWPAVGDVLDSVSEELIRSTSPQHREELIGTCHDGCDQHLPVPRGKLDQLVYLDGRFMFAACARELGCGPVERSFDGDLARLMYESNRYERARYEVTFTVPSAWRHPGLLPVKHPDGKHWHYPNRPGVTARGWVDGAELFNAHTAGWEIEFHDSMTYSGDLIGCARPLDGFVRLVEKARESLLSTGEQIAADAPPISAAKQLAAKALRACFIRAIGGFASRGRQMVHVVPAGVELPEGVRDWETRPDGRRVYRTRVQPTGLAAAYMRPELASQVWARARAKVNAAMMSTDPDRIIAVWGDALYMTSNPGWPDDGRSGRFRVKASLRGPITRPTTLGGLLKLRAKMTEE